MLTSSVCEISKTIYQQILMKFSRKNAYVVEKNQLITVTFREDLHSFVDPESFCMILYH